MIAKGKWITIFRKALWMCSSEGGVQQQLHKFPLLYFLFWVFSFLLFLINYITPQTWIPSQKIVKWKWFDWLKLIISLIYHISLKQFPSSSAYSTVSLPSISSSNTHPTSDLFYRITSNSNFTRKRVKKTNKKKYELRGDSITTDEPIPVISSAYSKTAVQLDGSPSTPFFLHTVSNTKWHTRHSQLFIRSTRIRKGPQFQLGFCKRSNRYSSKTYLL